MFKRFLSEHSFDEYKLNTKMFPTVSDREFWESFAEGGYVASAERYIDYNWPITPASEIMEFVRSGSRRSEQPGFERRDRLLTFALAELVENKGRFLPQIVNGLLAICEETSWACCAHWEDEIPHNFHDVRKPYIDLRAGETAEKFALIITLLREPLEEYCPEIIERVKYELEVRISEPYLTHTNYWWMGYGKRVPNNWNPWIISNVMTVFLLLEEDKQRLHRALEKMFVELQNYCDGMPDDGGCDEGPNYWDRAGASLFECVYLIKQASGGAIDLFDDAKFAKIGAYPKMVHVYKDYFASIADAHYVGLAGIMIMDFAYASETKQKDLMNFCAAVYQQRTGEVNPYHSGNMRRLFYHLEFFDKLKNYEVTMPMHEKLEFLPELQLAGLRQGEWLIFAKGGHNDESHNHNDIGSFCFHEREIPVLADLGIGIYTRFTFSEHRYEMVEEVKAKNHTIPSFDGVTQQYGRNYRADSFEASEDEIKISFASAYPKEAGLVSLERRLSFIENGMKCVDSFERESGADGKVSEVFISVLPVEITEDAAVINGRYRLSSNVGQVRGEYKKFNDASLEKSWKTDGYTRICVDAEGVDKIEIKIEII